MRKAILLLFLLVPVSASADTLCDVLADTMTRSQATTFAEISKASGGRIQVDQGSFDVPKQYSVADFDNAKFFRVGRSGAVVINTQGSMHCQSPAFFDGRGTQVKRISGPATLSAEGDAYCWDSYLELGSISGTPVLVAESDGDNRVSLEVTPWRENAWGKTCRLSAKFEKQLRIDNSYCGAGDCGDLDREAVAFAEAYRRDPKRAFTPANAQDSKLLTLGRRIKAPLLLLPTFGKPTTNPYQQFSQEHFSTVSIKGRRYLVIVGGGLFGWREYRGNLVGFWRLQGDELVAVAGYQIALQDGRPTSIQVLPDIGAKTGKVAN